MGRKKLTLGVKDMRRIVRLNAKNAKSKNRILASMDKCTKQCETKATESRSLRKLMTRDKGYVRGPKHLSTKHKAKIGDTLKRRKEKHKNLK